jgi:tetratricopeptide (TPR) repeat protein
MSVAVTVLAAPAFAQAHDPRAVTVLGGDVHARRCVNNVIAGDSSDETLASCTRALRYPRLSRSGEVQILINRGIVHLRRRESEAALADFDTVIARNPRHAEAHLNRGAALVQMNQPGPAVVSITEALSLGVDEPHKAYYNRGAAREALGDLRGAYEDYSTALEIRPDWGPANAELARFVRTRRDHLATVLGDSATP